jgi:hypothetical protein
MRNENHVWAFCVRKGNFMHSGDWDTVKTYRHDAAAARRLACTFSDFNVIRDLVGFANALEAESRDLVARARVAICPLPLSR